MDTIAPNSVDNCSIMEQLKKYAADLTRVYRAEKQKREELAESNRQLLKYAADLNDNFMKMKAAEKQLKEAYLDTIHRLVLAAEHRDEETGEHIVRVSRYCALLARKLGFSTDEVQIVIYAAPMHDVGKIGISDQILLKPGKLTRQEFEIMKTHTTIGAKILADSRSHILNVAEQIALSHHEKFNGTGYPLGLSGNDIPLCGRIMNLADTFDALTSRRPYKEPYPAKIAIGIIKSESGEHFDPEIVEIFLENIDAFLKIRGESDDDSPISKENFIWSERDREENKYWELAN